MKAKFFFLGLCALALAACSIDEVSQVNDTNAVTFKVTTSTRAEATTTNNIQEFTVWAWNENNLFMDAVTATRSGSTSTFVTSPLYFWPTGGVDFYALTEVGEHGVVDNKEYALLGGQIKEGDDTNPEWTYEGTVGYAVVENGGITIDACIPSKPEDQIDICYAVAVNKSSGSVPTNFRHALSQVAFKAKSINSAFDVKIADVSVCSVYKEGTYVVGKNDTATHLDAGTSTDPASGSQGKWTITETDDDNLAIKGRYLVNMEKSIVDVPADGSTVELVDPNGTLMLLPQEVDAWDPLLDYNDVSLGSYIRILCHVEEAGSQLWPTTSEEDTAEEDGSSFRTLGDGLEYAEIAIPVDAVWEQGYRYTYTIIFGEGLGYYPPDDPNVDLEGTPVLRIITFDVTVDEFQDAEGVDVPTDTDLSSIEVSSQAELEGAIRMGYAEIVLEDNITLEDHNLYFYNDCVLDLNGKTLTGVDLYEDEDCDGANSVIFVYGGTLTVNGPGTITTNGTTSDDSDGKGSGDTSIFWLYGGNLIINGGTFYGSSWSDPTGEYYTAASACVYVEEGFAYIYGGEFYSGYSKTFKEVSILNCWDTARKEGTAWIYVYGGTYYNGFDPANNTAEGTGTNFCADANGENITGYSIYDETTDSYTVHQRTTVTSLADINALINADTDDMITIAEDVALTGTFQDNNAVRILSNQKNINICIEEGATLTVTASADNTDYAGIYLGAGTVTVNLYGEGELRFDADGHEGCGFYPLWVQGLGSTLNIYGGDYEGYNCPDAVYVVLGTANVYGGTFGATDTYNEEYWLLNCEDANYRNGSAFIYAYGGSYYNFDPSDCVSEGAGTNFVVDGYVSTYDEGTGYYTVTAK